VSDVADWTTAVFGVGANDVTDLADWTTAVYGAGGTFGTGSGSGGGGPPPVTGLAVDWDASAITGVADGAALSSWADTPGGTHPLAQSTPAYKPTFYSTTAGYLVNGRPAVWFNGGQSMASTDPAAQLTQPVTLVAVVVPTAGALAYGFIYSGGGDPSGCYWQKGPQTLGMNRGNSMVGTRVAAAGVAHLVAFVMNSTSSVIYVDGASDTGDAGTEGTNTTGFTLGWQQIANNPWNGAICEVILYPSALTSGQLATIRGWAQSKWGTP
jgi:hypothetical protein